MQKLFTAKSRLFVLPIVTACIILLALYYSQGDTRSSPIQPYENHFGPVMGTEGYVKINASSSIAESAQDAFNYAYKKTKEAESLLSKFIASSDISKINSSEIGEKIQVSPITWRTLIDARRFYQLSNQAFDPTLGSLMDIYPWGEKKLDSLPDKTIITNALANSGLQHLTFHREGMFISRDNDKVIVDLGGIAKGLGVDIMARALRAQGVTEAIIEIGGEITIIGSNEFKQKSTQLIGSKAKIWTTGIKDPRGSGIVKEFTATGGVSIATSGDYEKFFQIGDKHYSHIIDPRTGYPTSSGIISATIITKAPCSTADALATTVSVIGVEQSKELLKLFPHSQAYIILEDGKEITIEGGVQELNLRQTTEGRDD